MRLLHLMHSFLGLFVIVSVYLVHLLYESSFTICPWNWTIVEMLAKCYNAWRVLSFSRIFVVFYQALIFQTLLIEYIKVIYMIPLHCDVHY